uniref:Uncharacterized protein n=1 Tax=Brassica oleracea TaxID=3712 RepID=A0A3P6B0H2_BRAOL|nr:unnamed protein product [Brassica oleracea]
MFPLKMIIDWLLILENRLCLKRMFWLKMIVNASHNEEDKLMLFLKIAAS